MRSSYKPIGKYIRRVEKRNTDLKVKRLLGLSMSKEFRETTSNIVGTDMSVYRVMEKWHFACDFMSPIRVNKLPVVLKLDDEPNLVSPAYPVFEVINKNELDPEYLMMWFRRSEFDRYTAFKCDSAIRGGYDWDELCNTELPVPHIDKQKEIVKEYKTIVERINLNNQLIQKLEETAQAIYKQWFVDFEFPDEEGKPYKSNGGEMEWNEELEKEVPKGWQVEKLSQFLNLSQGLVMNSTTTHLIKKQGLPLLRITDLINDTQKIFIDPSVPVKNLATKSDIIYTRTGQVGLVFRNKEGVVYNNCFKVVPKNDLISKDYIFWYLKQNDTYRLMVDLAAGSAQSDLSHSAFLSVQITAPKTSVQLTFSGKIVPIEKAIWYFDKESKLLQQMKDLLLSKLATIES